MNIWRHHMASSLVHKVHSLIAFALPYGHIHSKKDSFAQRVPGIRHREVRHHKYQAFGSTWDFTNSYPANEVRRIARILRWKGPEVAEGYMVSLSHDVDDKCWDFDGMPRAERAAVRKYWEAFCAWLVLNPDTLKTWAGVDVLNGRVHRIVDGIEVWTDEPALIGAFAALYNQVRFLLRRDAKLRAALIEYGAVNPNSLPEEAKTRSKASRE